MSTTSFAIPWTPKRTIAEANAMLCAPGGPLELETILINGGLYRTYKNLPTSLRALFFWACDEYRDQVYIVFEGKSKTYGETLQATLKAAAVFKSKYGVNKGDRIGIAARNYPTWLEAFWAAQLLGAVPVLINAWLPDKTIQYCVEHTQCVVVVLDSERADRLESRKMQVPFLVCYSHEGKGQWDGMKLWKDVVEGFQDDVQHIIGEDPLMVPEDNATIMFTSGTTGLPKGVLSTQRMFLTNLFNCQSGGGRAAFRRGENEIPAPVPGPQKGMLVSVPLFHITGLSANAVLATLLGMKVVLMRKWAPEEAAKLISKENVTIAGGVPSMVVDLVESSSDGRSLEALSFGGCPAPDILATQSLKKFPTTALSTAYGLTETNSVAISFAAEDYYARPTSCGLPSPVNDVIIVQDGKAQKAGEIGEVWLRGPNIMKGYWNDPAATAKALTKDGWFRTGDLGVLDEEGFLYIRDRIKDLIIRGGENIDSVSVENALYSDDRLLEVAAVGIPDKKLGELVGAVVSVKPRYKKFVTEAELLKHARKSLPSFAVPVLIIIQEQLLERNPSGKILKPILRKKAEQEWIQRKSAQAQSKL